MDDQDTEQATTPTTADRAVEVAAGDGREDDRNVALDESPVPDPEATDADAGDDPEAD